MKKIGSTAVLRQLSNLASPPDGVDLFIYDLPDYYAVGDRNLVLVHRNDTRGEHPHDQTLIRYLYEPASYRLISRMRREKPNAPADFMTVLVYESALAPLSEADRDARLRQFVEPLRKAAARADASWAKLLLTD